MSKFALTLAIAGMLIMGRVAVADDKPAEKAAAEAPAAEKHATEKPASTPAALNFKVQSLEGKEVDLSKYQGKVVVIVNVASKCGLTPQYKALENLYQKHESKGLVILGFPCNQFHSQEPGSAAEIRQYCTSKYNVTFPLMAKVEVNGAGACDLYKYLKALDAKPKGSGEVSWNFEKFVIGRNGEVVARFTPQTTPGNADFIKTILDELAKK